MKQSVQVNIQGQEFSLKTDLPVAEVEAVADFVNEQIGQIAAEYEEARAALEAIQRGSSHGEQPGPHSGGG